MNENQLKFLWDNYANNKGFSGYDEFKSLMANDNSRKVFFENSNKELGFKDYNEFEGVLGVKKKKVRKPLLVSLYSSLVGLLRRVLGKR